MLAGDRGAQRNLLQHGAGATRRATDFVAGCGNGVCAARAARRNAGAARGVRHDACALCAAAQEKELGTDHPDVAKTLNDMAIVYKKQQKYALVRPSPAPRCDATRRAATSRQFAPGWSRQVAAWRGRMLPPGREPIRAHAATVSACRRPAGGGDIPKGARDQGAEAGARRPGGTPAPACARRIATARARYRRDVRALDRTRTAAAERAAPSAPSARRLGASRSAAVAPRSCAPAGTAASAGRPRTGGPSPGRHGRRL